MDINNYCYNCMHEKEADVSVCPHCGFENASYVPQRQYLPPKTPLNGKYIIGRVMGNGSFGITYIGYDMNLKIVVAIKELFIKGVNDRGLNHQVVTNPSKQAVFEVNRERFRREASVLARINENDGEGIVYVRDYFEENKTAYIVMEYLDGVTLRDHIVHNGPICLEDAKKLLGGICRTLSKVHAYGDIHKDISPDNIMVLASGGAKLMDFGGTVNLPYEDVAPIVSNKRGYVAPEQYVSGGMLGSWTDVYALAATLHFALSGINPPDAMNRRAGAVMASLRDKKVKLDSKVEKSILQALELDPRNRIVTMEAFYDAVFDLKREPNRKLLAVIGVVAAVGLTIALWPKGGDKPVEPQQTEPTHSGSELNQGSEAPWYQIGQVMELQVGTYIVSSAADSELILGIDSGFADNGAALKLVKRQEKNSNRIMLTGQTGKEPSYHLQAAHTNSYLQLRNPAKPESEVIQFTKAPGDSTGSWQFLYAGEVNGKTAYRIRNGNGKVLAPAEDADLKAGMKLVLKDMDVTDDSQKWLLSWNARDAAEGNVVVYQTGDFVNSLSGIYEFASVYDADQSKISVSSYEALTEPELILWKSTWSDSQRFELQSVQGGYYKIYSKLKGTATQKVLEYDPKTGKILVRAESDSRNQLFRAQYQGYNTYLLVTSDGMVLGYEPQKDGKVNGNAIVAKAQDSFSDAALPKWFITAVK